MKNVEWLMLNDTDFCNTCIDEACDYIGTDNQEAAYDWLVGERRVPIDRSELPNNVLVLIQEMETELLKRNKGIIRLKVKAERLTSRIEQLEKIINNLAGDFDGI